MSRVRLDWIGLTLIAWSVLARALVMAEPMPGWDADPTRIAIAIIGIGPTGSLLLDALAWLGAGLVLSSRRSRHVEPLALLAIVGAVLVVWRTLLLDAQNVEAIRIGSSWAAGWASLAAMASVAHRPLVRSVLGSVLIAFVLMLGAKAVVQVFVEHPLMLEQFDSDKPGNLAAQGFQPGSEQALIYERRLRQPDPTGWFGLSNVLATYLALGVVTLFAAGLACNSMRRTVLVIASVAIGCILMLTGSKAGIGVAVLGLSAFAASRLLPHKLAFPAILAFIALPTAAVLLRGMTGWPEGEKSLLFRWFYAQGAAGVSLDALPFGTGPAGFQDAYMLSKPPMATEDVSSPHMILWDYLATMGFFGLPLIAALLWATARLAQNAMGKTRHAVSRTRLLQIRPVMVVMLIAPIFLSVWLESQATTLEGALARLVGVVAWGGLAMLLVSIGLPTRRILALAGVVLLCHAQLDMALTLPGSVPLALALIGLAVSTHRQSAIKASRAIPIAIATAGLLGTCWLSPGVWRWESYLRGSSQRFAEILTARDTLLAGPATPADLRDLDQRMKGAMERAFEDLSEASRIKPSDGRAAMEAARIGVALANALRQAGRFREADDLMNRSQDLLDRSFNARQRSGLAAQIGNLGLIRAEWAEAAGESAEKVRMLRDEAIKSIEEAARLAPYSPRHPTRLALTHFKLGETQKAAQWARLALDLNDSMSLDPLSALPESVRAQVERIAGSP